MKLQARSITAGLITTLALSLPACTKKESPGAQAALAPAFTEVKRQDFNRTALELGYSFFWSDDENANGKLEPDELRMIFAYGDESIAPWVTAGTFTPAFRDAYLRIKAESEKPVSAPATSDPEVLRQAALKKELQQSYFTMLASDFTKATPEERALVSHVLNAARLIEALHARQLGSFGLDASIGKDDTLGRFVFFLNQTPWCSGPTTENDPNCNAVASRPARISGLYPAALQSDRTFCDQLDKHKKRTELMDPFTVVVQSDKGELLGIPYTEAYKEGMQAVSRELDLAAQAITSESEAALRAYLTAAAQAFRDNKWQAADELWAKMNAQNSKWYLRIAPDEVYFEPCSRKAGFHVSFARINERSLAWQKKLDPVKSEMEKAIAALAGAPYKVREVAFHLPDFIDVIVNAGDSRDARGATIGQSLPNWGPVANEGRGRTVAMANFYTDPDSKTIRRAQAGSMFCADSMSSYVDDPDAEVIGTVLHEAAHNLGPAHEYRVRGKTDDETFGGPLASTLEELKAQTSALYLEDWLVSQGVVTRDLADKAHVRDLAWALGHISRGMFDAEGKPKPYSQTGAIQLGFFLKEGALEWHKGEKAASGSDTGCLSIKLDKLPAAIAKLEGVVLGIKARGDVPAQKALFASYVDDQGEWKTIMEMVAVRFLRQPRASFLYSVRL